MFFANLKKMPFFLLNLSDPKKFSVSLIVLIFASLVFGFLQGHVHYRSVQAFSYFGSGSTFANLCWHVFYFISTFLLFVTVPFWPIRTSIIASTAIGVLFGISYVWSWHVIPPIILTLAILQFLQFAILGSGLSFLQKRQDTNSLSGLSVTFIGGAAALSVVNSIVYVTLPFLVLGPGNEWLMFGPPPILVSLLVETAWPVVVGACVVTFFAKMKSLSFAASEKRDIQLHEKHLPSRPATGRAARPSFSANIFQIILGGLLGSAVGGLIGLTTRPALPVLGEVPISIALGTLFQPKDNVDRMYGSTLLNQIIVWVLICAMIGALATYLVRLLVVRTNAVDDARKKCPYCAEQILTEATFCKHCRRDLIKVSA